MRASQVCGHARGRVVSPAVSRDTKTVGVVLLVPDPIGSQVTAVRARVGDERGMDIPAHITLLPPTVIDAASYERLHAHLRSVAPAHQRLRIHLCGTDSFRPVSQVVFMAIGEGAQACTDLHADVCEGPVGSSSPFPFYPHITLAHDVSPEVLEKVASDHADERAAFDVHEMCLYDLDDEQGWQLRSRYAFDSD